MKNLIEATVNIYHGRKLNSLTGAERAVVKNLLDAFYLVKQGEGDETIVVSKELRPWVPVRVA